MNFVEGADQLSPSRWPVLELPKKANDNASYFQEAKRPLAAEQRLALL